MNELPGIINPDAGFVISTNQRLTSKNVKHGISFAQSMSYRAIRMRKLLNDYVNNGTKIGFEEQRRI